MTKFRIMIVTILLSGVHAMADLSQAENIEIGRLDSFAIEITDGARLRSFVSDTHLIHAGDFLSRERHPLASLRKGEVYCYLINTPGDRREVQVMAISEVFVGGSQTLTLLLNNQVFWSVACFKHESERPFTVGDINRALRGLMFVMP